MQRHLREIRESTAKAKHLCFFGVGALLQDCFEQLVLSVGREPDFLCDNAEGKWGNEFFGITCISPAQLGELGDSTAVVITVRNFEEIHSQLHSLGIGDVFAACYDRCFNHVQSIRKIEGGNPPAAPGGAPHIGVQGKWTLVTGASRGVGLQIALSMAALGSNIIAHSRSAPHVREVVDACTNLGVQAVPVAAELSDLNEVDAMLSELERLVPHVDIIFNNAAIPCSAGFWSSTSEDYLSCFVVNTLAPVRICQRLIPFMKERGFGRVVNITSSVQKRPDVSAYACSKAALDKFVYDLAPSLTGTGVMLTLVDPGWLRTDMTAFNGPHSVESVIPGALLGALIDGDVNGRWFSAQDYAGLDLPSAIRKAAFLLNL